MKKPQFHLTPPRGWMNDPNGFIFYRGQYHLFYQHFPYAPRWGTMHWGHAVSRDLTDWTHRPVALFPTCEEDRNGCFSGSALERDGKLHLYYTGVRYDRVGAADIHVPVDNAMTACQLHIASDDGETFDNFGGKDVAVPVIADGALGHHGDTRDPKVWTHEGRDYLLLGTRSAAPGRSVPGLLLYRRDTGGWSLLSRMSCPGLGTMWECPDLYEVDGRWILCVSPMNMATESQRNRSLAGPVRFDPATGAIAVDPGRLAPVDAGLDVYAPQTNHDADGRRVIVGWLRTPAPFPGADWQGMMTMPRVVSFDRGALRWRPHPHIVNRFAVPLAPEDASLRAPLRIRASAHPGGRLDLGGLQVVFQDGKVVVDRSRVFPCSSKPGGEWPSVLEAPAGPGPCEAEIYVDHGIAEIFVDGGRSVVTTALYDPGTAVRGEGLDAAAFSTL